MIARVCLSHQAKRIEIRSIGQKALHDIEARTCFHPYSIVQPYIRQSWFILMSLANLFPFKRTLPFSNIITREQRAIWMDILKGHITCIFKQVLWFKLATPNSNTAQLEQTELCRVGCSSHCHSCTCICWKCCCFILREKKIRMSSTTLKFLCAFVCVYALTMRRQGRHRCTAPHRLAFPNWTLSISAWIMPLSDNNTKNTTTITPKINDDVWTEGNRKL